MTRYIVLSFLCLALFGSVAFAELPKDEEIAKLFVGKWNRQMPPGSKDRATTTFDRDGTFSGVGRVADGKIEYKAEGKWRIENGVLIEEITKSSHPERVPAGTVSKDTLISVTKDEFRYQKGASAVSYKRAADEAKPSAPK